MSVDVTIRFPQIDAAGILFYPRCFELLARYFERTPIDASPVTMQTTFTHPLRLGDRIALQLEQDGSTMGLLGDASGARVLSCGVAGRVSRVGRVRWV